LISAILFCILFAVVAVFDVRGMRKIGLSKELWLYAAFAAVCVVLAFAYFPEINRRSIMSFILQILRIEW